MFPSFVENPQNCSFEGQDADEKILLLLRAHPITNLSWIISAFLLVLLPFLIPSSLFFLKVDTSFLPPLYGLVLAVINYLLVAVIVFEGFLYWYFNVFLVTDKNIIDVDFNSILFKNIDMAPLKNIEDVSSSISGLMQSIFHYGNVFIQTAGAARNFEFNNVSQPDRVADFILDQSHKINNSPNL
ncbi:hypothetical protein A3B45_02775 [Candidatus Daviesbacteria bacterium RIFCSPLOWO2_01_FULL_39_12]|uniref:DUF304 domain-containing protein n=1 Tax=Candidatus Daviesbacteria bacterium RIFCSPLOWO2_01_FULL_39_12 TaxID=1797785 RepID=A0A1F5KSX9_9BACT|nr:MAG: hypothetical protein A3D79_02445 [Candidatus Daviesbacteria bacterium RIFCSPHIGHO2_02_FULL_39_8]OGE43929.1 MAG: hypothetical protein A3B45_02775 [Candidatus Daviesbacteria bacterium RIFCSPLOWO2_01_FULL_39_12]